MTAVKTAAADPSDDDDLSPATERFCACVAIGDRPADAYRTAYPDAREWGGAEVELLANDLLASAAIVARIAELRATMPTVHGITVPSILGTLDDAERIAHEKKDARTLVEIAKARYGICNFGKAVKPQTAAQRRAADAFGPVLDLTWRDYP